MTTQTSLVAEQVRLQQWAEQVRDRKNRPRGMDVETWCAQNNITKANYYYRLRRVRKACLDQLQTEQQVISTLSYINQKLGKTIVMVTHDPKMASYCDRIILLKDGRILDTLVKEENNNEIFYQNVLRQMVRI